MITLLFIILGLTDSFSIRFDAQELCYGVFMFAILDCITCMIERTLSRREALKYIREAVEEVKKDMHS